MNITSMQVDIDEMGYKVEAIHDDGSTIDTEIYDYDYDKLEEAKNTARKLAASSYYRVYLYRTEMLEF